MDYTKKDLRDAQAILRDARDRGGDWKLLWSANGWLDQRIALLAPVMREPVMRLDAGEPIGELVGGGR